MRWWMGGVSSGGYVYGSMRVCGAGGGSGTHDGSADGRAGCGRAGVDQKPGRKGHGNGGGEG